MATTTMTQYRHLAADAHGNPLPLGDGYLGNETRASAGAFAAVSDACRFVRIATDTAYNCDVASAGASEELLNAGSSEYFAVAGGQVVTLSAL